jgi:hypothetical protein
VTLTFSSNDFDGQVEAMVDLDVKVIDCLTVALNRLQMHGKPHNMS